MFILFVISWYLYFVRQAGYVFKGVELQDTLYTNRHAGNVFKGVELHDALYTRYRFQKFLVVSACQHESEVCQKVQAAFGISLSEVYMFELSISSGWHRFYLLDFEMYGGIVS